VQKKQRYDGLNKLHKVSAKCTYQKRRLYSIYQAVHEITSIHEVAEPLQWMTQKKILILTDTDHQI